MWDPPKKSKSHFLWFPQWAANSRWEEGSRPYHVNALSDHLKNSFTKSTGLSHRLYSVLVCFVGSSYQTHIHKNVVYGATISLLALKRSERTACVCGNYNTGKCRIYSADTLVWEPGLSARQHAHGLAWGIHNSTLENTVWTSQRLQRQSRAANEHRTRTKVSRVTLPVIAFLEPLEMDISWTVLLKLIFFPAFFLSNDMATSVMIRYGNG